MKTWRWTWFCCLLVVAAGCSHAGSRQAKATLEFYSAEESESRDWRCHDYDERCVVLAAAPALKIDAPRFDVAIGQKPSISIALSTAQRRELSHLGERGTRIALVVGGQVLHVAKLRGPLTGKGLQLSFCNRADFVRVVQALQPPG